MSRLARDGTAELVSRDRILRRERGQGNVYFPCSADHDQDWQPYQVDPYSAIPGMQLTYIHAAMLLLLLSGIIRALEVAMNQSGDDGHKKAAVDFRFHGHSHSR